MLSIWQIWWHWFQNSIPITQNLFTYFDTTSRTTDLLRQALPFWSCRQCRGIRWTRACRASPSARPRSSTVAITIVNKICNVSGPMLLLKNRRTRIVRKKLFPNSIRSYWTDSANIWIARKVDCPQECHLFKSTKHSHLPTFLPWYSSNPIEA